MMKLRLSLGLLLLSCCLMAQQIESIQDETAVLEPTTEIEFTTSTNEPIEPIMEVEGTEAVSYVEYTSAGTYYFTPHLSSTKVKVEAIGGGGASNYVKANHGWTGTVVDVAGAGGGGGAYASGKATVNGGQSHEVKVGAGGTNTGEPVHGGDSSFNGKQWDSSNSVKAAGGKTGVKIEVDSDYEAEGAAGGKAVNSWGTTRHNGGNGGNGKKYSSGGIDYVRGGGGGSAGFKIGNGNNGSPGYNDGGGAGGLGSGISGSGGKGAHEGDMQGGSGNIYGGGGGGSTTYKIVKGSSSQNGAPGASGYVKINYITIENVSFDTTNDCVSTPITISGLGYTQDGNPGLTIKVNGTSITGFTINNDNQITIHDLGSTITPLTGSNILIESANGDAKSVALIKNNSRELIAGNGNWSAASSWKNDLVPDENSCVRIPSGKKVTVNTTTAKAKNLTVDNGGELIIATNQALTVTDFVKNNSTADQFVVKDGGSLVQINNGNINTGAIKVEKQFKFSAGRQQYNFVSIPVEDFFLKGSATNDPLYAGMSYVLKYNEATDYFVNATNADHITGKGFAIKEATGSGAQTVNGIFTGVPFNGNASIALAKTGQGFNVIGNPYPSTLDLAQFYADNNTKIESTVWFWDNRGNTLFEQQGSSYAGTNYASYNFVAGGGTGVAAPSGVVPTQYLRPGTGFMVQAKSNGAFVNFNNTQRVTNTAPAFVGKNANLDEVNRYWLYMKTPDQLKVNMAVVYFEGGNSGYSIDDSDAFGSSDELYSLTDNQQVIIQGKEPFAVTDVVPMGFRAFKRGNYSIAISDKEGVFANGQKIYLRDKDLGVTHDFNQGAYSFKTQKGEFNNRFEIVYKPNKKASLNSLAEVANVVHIQKVNQQIEVKSSLDKIVEVEIFNLSGRSIVKANNIHELNWTMPTKTIDKQILVVVVKTETGEVVTQKVITK